MAVLRPLSHVLMLWSPSDAAYRVHRCDTSPQYGRTLTFPVPWPRLGRTTATRARSCNWLKRRRPALWPPLPGRDGYGVRWGAQMPTYVVGVPHNGRVRVAGVNIKSGHTFVAISETVAANVLGAAKPSLSARLTVNAGLEDAAALADLRDRVMQSLRASKAEAVGLVATRAYAGWKYKDAYSRISAVCSVMLACTELSLPFREIKTSVIGKAVGVPATNLKSVDHTSLGLAAAPTYWTTGMAEAYAAAATLISEGVAQ